MKRPVAHPTTPVAPPTEPVRAPRAFATTRAELAEADFDAETATDLVAPPPRRMGWIGRLAWTTGGILVSAGLGLAADRLIRDLFATQPWLGWAALVVLALFLLALIALAMREILALRRLRVLDALRAEAALAHETDDRRLAEKVVGQLDGLYSHRADLARTTTELQRDHKDLFDGEAIIELAERRLMAPLDARAQALTAGAARRVALVTAVSPRALVDIAFVAYESIRLAGAIANLYGARPGFLGRWRLAGAILAHLAVTGGLVLTDGVVEQLVGQGLAAKLSARLGEGVVNGLMTVRVGIAAMRVVRPLPHKVLPSPTVRDFIPALTRIGDETRAPSQT